MEETIKQIANDFSIRIKDSHIYFSPDIPTDKLKKALSSYGEGVKEENALVLLDNTLFGGAKDGALLTPEAFHVHNQYEKPRSMRLSDIQKVLFTPGWPNGILYVNGEKFLETNMPGKEAMESFSSMLSEIISQSSSEAVLNSPSKAAGVAESNQKDSPNASTVFKARECYKNEKGKTFTVYCPGCGKQYIIPALNFSPSRPRKNNGLTLTDKVIPYGREAWGWILGFVVAFLVGGVLIGITGELKFWITITGVAAWIFSKNLINSNLMDRLPVWHFNCESCRQLVIIASDGNTALSMGSSLENI